MVAAFIHICLPYFSGAAGELSMQWHAAKSRREKGLNCLPLKYLKDFEIPAWYVDSHFNDVSIDYQQPCLALMDAQISQNTVVD